jgi:hypothetical protein
VRGACLHPHARLRAHQRFEKLFTANDVEKGGSFYLQSKIVRARESLYEYYKALGHPVTDRKIKPFEPLQKLPGSDEQPEAAADKEKKDAATEAKKK